MTAPDGITAVMDLRRLALAAGFAAALRAAVELSVADALDDEAQPATKLATTVGADGGALARLLRALCAHGVFAVEPDGTYRHTPASRLLRADHPRSIRDMMLWATEPWTWTVWPRLADAVRTGRGGFAKAHGKDFFTYLHEDAPASAHVFDRAMTQSSRLSAGPLAEALDVRGPITVADVAGGQGHLLATILERDAGPRGVLFDLPAVVASPDRRLAAGGPLAARTSVVAGDCRQRVPVRADVYVLKNVLEWDDAGTLATLRNVAAAAPEGARVAVVENLVDGSPETAFTTAMDLLLLLNVDGRKHRRDDLVRLCREAGLRVVDVCPVGPFLHLIDCRTAAVR